MHIEGLGYRWTSIKKKNSVFSVLLSGWKQEETAKAHTIITLQKKKNVPLCGTLVDRYWQSNEERMLYVSRIGPTGIGAGNARRMSLYQRHVSMLRIMHYPVTTSLIILILVPLV